MRKDVNFRVSLLSLSQSVHNGMSSSMYTMRFVIAILTTNFRRI
jgi:hypothetical protein